jgi:DNA-binding LytR/AlgR family response regulator
MDDLMRYKIAIVEDDDFSSHKIEDYINKYSKEKKYEFTIFKFKDGDEITSNYEAIYDIIFLDIEMKRQNGMDTAKKIRTFDQEVIIIFITNMSQYAIKGYAVNALSFLLKPVPYFAFSQELEKSIKRCDSKKGGSVLVPTSKGLIKLDTKNILFIESIKHQLYIHTKKDVYIIRDTMKHMEEELKKYHFYRCHSGYLVNFLQVDSIVKDEVIINNQYIKISRPRKKEFIEAFTNYLGDKR